MLRFGCPSDLHDGARTRVCRPHCGRAHSPDKSLRAAFMGVRYAYRALFWTPRIRSRPQAARPSRERRFVSPCHSAASRTEGEELVMATLSLFEQSAPSAAVSESAGIIARERQKSLMIRAWILCGLFFMTLPVTLLGFSNLVAISVHPGFD